MLTRDKNAPFFETRCIYTNMDMKNVTVGIYLDLQKVFDTVDHGILLHKLYVYGIRGIMLDWFRNYLRNRQQIVTLTDISSDVGNITCGIPQGSVLGPLLFLRASAMLKHVLAIGWTSVRLSVCHTLVLYQNG